jgi:hypothetical protein
MERVEPVVARKGTFIKSFRAGQYQEMLNYGYETEMAMFRNRIMGALVFTQMTRKANTWQIFLLPEGTEP